jgi:hypothetical protein
LIKQGLTLGIRGRLSLLVNHRVIPGEMSNEDHPHIKHVRAFRKRIPLRDRGLVTSGKSRICSLTSSRLVSRRSSIRGQDTAEWFRARASRNRQPTDLNKSP